MKIEQLPGQWVWVTAGSPLLFRSPAGGPSSVPRDLIVRVERIEPATAATPALAIWADAEGEHGVEARLVRSDVVSLPPSGHSPVAKAAEAIERRVAQAHRR